MKTELNIQIEFDDENLYVQWRGRLTVIPHSEERKAIIRSKMEQVQADLLNEVLNGVPLKQSP